MEARMHIIDVWVNCPDEDVADAISDALIEERLAACANVFPSINSSYRWKGTVEKENEIPLLLKTRADHFVAVCKRVRELHPYETPSIIGLKLEFVDPDYAQWVLEETEAAH